MFFLEKETLYFFPDGLTSLSPTMLLSLAISTLSGLILLYSTDLARIVDSQSHVTTAHVVLSMIFGPLFLFGLGFLLSTIPAWIQQRRARVALREPEEFLGTPLQERAELIPDSLRIDMTTMTSVLDKKGVSLMDGHHAYTITPKQRDPELFHTMFGPFSADLPRNPTIPLKNRSSKKIVLS